MVRHPINTVLKIPNSLDFLPLCSAYIEQTSQLIGFNPEEIQAVSLAAEEALSNLVLHAYTPGQKDIIEITCWQTPLGIEIIFKDKGMPFDYEQIEEYDPDKLELEDNRGMGMYLMKQAVDEVIFTNRGSEGRETHLIKYITQCPLDDLFSEGEKKDQKKIVRQKADFIIRRLKNGEAIEVSKAIYIAYGYNYFNEHAYYPERIEKLNQNGNLITAAAITADNKFAGTCAIYRSSLSDKLGELEQAVVLPQYRGNSGMEKMLEYLLKLAREQKMVGLYAKAETSEFYAQRALQRLETKDCAILLGFTSRIVWARNNSSTQRESMLLTYLPLLDDLPKKIYVPEHHQQIVRSIYANFGCEREFSQPPRGKKPWYEESELDIKYFYNTAAADIKVARLGKDIISKLKSAKKEVKLKKFAVIYLYLSLENPFTTQYIEKIENLDFFFAGVIPHEKYGDCIILQYLNNIDVDISKLVLYSDFARELAEYISQCRTRHPLRLMIDGGESEKLEFKSTLRLNLGTNKKDSRMGYAALKSIAAFLNTGGGTLLVGVDDKGNVIGIEIENFANDDKYLLYFSQLIQNNIGLENAQLVHYRLVEIEGKKVLKVDCEPSTKPIYLKIENIEDFYIRSGPASKKLPVSAAVAYINDHFIH